MCLENNASCVSTSEQSDFDLEHVQSKTHGHGLWGLSHGHLPTLKYPVCRRLTPTPAPSVVCVLYSCPGEPASGPFPPSPVLHAHLGLLLPTRGVEGTSLEGPVKYETRAGFTSGRGKNDQEHLKIIFCRKSFKMDYLFHFTLSEVFPNKEGKFFRFYFFGLPIVNTCHICFFSFL